MQHYYDIVRINEIAGNGRVPEDDLSMRHTVFTRQLGLIQEEVKELAEGYLAENEHEVRDGVADVLVTTHGLIHRMGWYEDLYFKLITVQLDEDIRLDWPPGWALTDYLQAIPAVGPGAAHAGTALAAGLVRTAMIFTKMYGADVEADMKAVYESLLSKFDADPETAELTRQKYERLGVVTEIRKTTVEGTDYYVTVSSRDQVGNDSVVYPAGKFLKSVHFRQPVFAQSEYSKRREQALASESDGVPQLITGTDPVIARHLSKDSAESSESRHVELGSVEASGTDNVQ